MNTKTFPTTILRVVERMVNQPIDEIIGKIVKQDILQQLWIDPNENSLDGSEPDFTERLIKLGEWRDVPKVKE